MKTRQKNKAKQQMPNKLCSSCRRACKQAAKIIVAKCPRYYPIRKIQNKTNAEFTWKQLELAL